VVGRKELERSVDVSQNAPEISKGMVNDLLFPLKLSPPDGDVSVKQEWSGFLVVEICSLFIRSSVNMSHWALETRENSTPY
jgi:hypothetical protein